MKGAEMLRMTMLGIVAMALLAGIENLTAQESTDKPQTKQTQSQSTDTTRGEQGTQLGQERPRFMRGGFDSWLDRLTEAHKQKDWKKVEQLIEDMKQARERRPRGMDRAERGGPPEGMRRPEAGMTSSQDRPLFGNAEVEKKILSVLEDMRQSQGRWMMNVPPQDGRLLRLLTEATGAKHVVEIGTSNGCSALWFCLALRTTGGKLTTHEIDARRASLARENFKRADVDKIVTLIEGDAHETVKKLKEPIDILFIDADKPGYVDYLNKLLPLVRPGGLILAHNVGMRGQIQDYVEAVTTNPELETTFYQQGGGMSVTLKKRQSK